MSVEGKLTAEQAVDWVLRGLVLPGMNGITMDEATAALISRLQAENEGLRKQRAEWIDSTHKLIAQLEAEKAELAERVGRLEKALEWYADQEETK